jgi:hypothetical protein
MMVNTIRCAASNMHASIRRFDCTACCCLPLMQVDRSLCMTRRPALVSHPQLVRCAGESPGGTRREYTCRLLWSRGQNRQVGRSRRSRPPLIRIGDALTTENCSTRRVRGKRGGMRDPVEIMSRATSRARRAPSHLLERCRVKPIPVRARKMRQTRKSEPGSVVSEPNWPYSPLSMSRSSRNGSALGGAEASCRIAL